MGQILNCDFSSTFDEYMYEVTEERGGSIKRAFGRKYYLIVPQPIAGGQEATESRIEVRTKSLQSSDEDNVTINGLKKEEYLASIGLSPDSSNMIDKIASFVRNPLVQKQITTGYVSGKIIPFKDSFKIIHLREYVSSSATVAGTIRIIGSEGDTKIR